MYYEKTQGIAVSVTPEYLPAESSPSGQAEDGAEQYVFAYHIVISNESELTVQLMTRHWIITDGRGRVHEVQGDGVVGEQPRLAPGESHRYSSFCPLETPTGNMRGSYGFVNTLGAAFDVRIPLFFLRTMDVRGAAAPGVQ